MKISICSLLMISLTLVFLSGCNQSLDADYSTLQLARVRGTVTLNGHPLPDATVMLVDDNRQFSSGKTNTRGQFEMWYTSEARGATPGKKTVRIQMSGIGEDERIGEDQPAGNSISELSEIYHS